MLDWYTYETAGAKARRAAKAGRIEPVRARWLEICWYGVGGLGVLGMLVMGFGAISEFREGEGVALLICSPLAALVPVTLGLGLRRSARIEQALDQLVAAARPADPPIPDPAEEPAPGA